MEKFKMMTFSRSSSPILYEFNLDNNIVLQYVIENRDLCVTFDISLFLNKNYLNISKNHNLLFELLNL